MKSINTDIAIIGSGLTGLTLAYRLRDSGRSVALIEARDRAGGRIHTLKKPGLPPMEMGATWLGRKHTALWELLQELGVGVFEQGYSDRAIYEPMSISPAQLVALPANEDPSYRIQGGSSALIKALVDTLRISQFYPGQRVQGITATEIGAVVKTTDTVYVAKQVVSTLPPYLLVQSVAFTPSLSDQLLDIANNTNTWMGESIKVALAYAKPFWREAGRSGTIFSNVGPITEMYDHANYEDNAFALKGFFNGSYYSISREE
ncbi:MAG: FAD-dependent oxidoreductase, partial [Bacteroidota bacterium]